jgi:hypothetical protein
VPSVESLFGSYEASIRQLPERLDLSHLVDDRYLLEQSGRLEIYYAPFDWVRMTARVAIIGITPGGAQMLTSYQVVVDTLRAGGTAEEALQQVKSIAAFNGFRKPLTGWLDYLGLPSYLGLTSSGELWEPRGEALLHSTSAIRYPVFKEGNNFSGSSPSPVNDPMLRSYLLDVLSKELALIPGALVIPLGRAVEDALWLLYEEDLIDASRVLWGFPYPGGAFAQRYEVWDEEKGRLRDVAERWFSRHPVPGRAAQSGPAVPPQPSCADPAQSGLRMPFHR